MPCYLNVCTMLTCIYDIQHLAQLAVHAAPNIKVMDLISRESYQRTCGFICSFKNIYFSLD